MSCVPIPASVIGYVFLLTVEEVELNLGSQRRELHLDSPCEIVSLCSNLYSPSLAQSWKSNCFHQHQIYTINFKLNFMVICKFLQECKLNN